MNRERTTRGLILAGNVTIGHQISALLKHNGWQTQVVYKDRDAYRTIHRGGLDSIITDIDTHDLGGLAVMIWCNNYHPSIIPYAICRNGQRQIMRLARDFGGCAGYFYLKDEKPLEIDTSHGMAARFTDGFPEPAEEHAVREHGTRYIQFLKTFPGEKQHS